MSVVVNAEEFNSALDREVKNLENRFRIVMKRLASEGMRRLLARTPVNTGQAVMSYKASVGTPKYVSAAAGTPVEPTNKLPLGVEQLRGPAEAVALSTLNGLDFSDPFTVVYITNNAPHIKGLEYGELPNDPYVPRSPNGMFGVTVQELTALLSRMGIMK